MNQFRLLTNNYKVNCTGSLQRREKSNKQAAKNGSTIAPLWRRAPSQKKHHSLTLNPLQFVIQNIFRKAVWLKQYTPIALYNNAKNWTDHLLRGKGGGSKVIFEILRNILYLPFYLHLLFTKVRYLTPRKSFVFS